MPALTLGYKASAEQFPPQRLLDLAVAAEDAGFDSVWTSDHFQPWRHTDGHAPNALVWLGAATQATRRVILGHERPHARRSATTRRSSRRRSRTLGCLAPGRVILGVGTGETLNEVAGGRRLARAERALRAAARSASQLIQAAVARRAAHDRGRVLPHRRTPRSTTGPTEPVPDLHRRVGTRGRPPRRAHRGRLHLHERQGRGAVHGDAAAGASPRAPRRPAGTPSAMDKMIEMKVSFDTDLRPGHGGHEGLGGARAPRRAEDGHPRRARDGGGRQGGRAVRPQALAGVRRTPTSTSSRSRRTSATGSTTWCSTSRARTRRRRSPATAS